MKSFERDIDSATEALAVRNALTLGFTSLDAGHRVRSITGFTRHTYAANRWNSLIAEDLNELCRLLQL